MREIILGVVQGLTEFLPISSSGHLVLVPSMLGWEEPALGLTVMLHLGTLVALLVYFRRDLLGLAAGALNKGPDPAASRRLIRFLAVGTIPAVIAGVAFGEFFEASFHRPYQSSAELLLTAVILFATERFGQRVERRALDDKRALGIGTAQAFAILPGISRSGATIGAGLLAGLTREEATRFSFLLSIPAIAGAGLLDVVEGELTVTAAALAGTVAAGVSSFLAIHYLLRFVRSHSLTVFCWYILAFAPLSALVVWLRS